MRKNMSKILNYIFVLYFFITMVIVYKDIGSPVAFKLVMGFLIYLVIYFIIKIGSVLKRTKRSGNSIIAKVIKFFFLVFGFLLLVKYIDLLKPLKDLSLIKMLPLAVGASFGITFGYEIEGENEVEDIE